MRMILVMNVHCHCSALYTKYILKEIRIYGVSSVRSVISYGVNVFLVLNFECYICSAYIFFSGILNIHLVNTNVIVNTICC
jgi:hypothetical protein